MRVVVTGGAGFIGANLVRRLLADGDDVVVIDDLSTGDRANLADVDGDVELVEASILDGDAVRGAVRGASSIVNLAARGSVPLSVADPVASHDRNTTGTMAVLEAARAEGVGHVVHASSSAVYGANPHLPRHEGLLPMPVSPYAATKLANEAYLLSWAACYDLAVLPFRFFNVFGPMQPPGHAYAAVVPAFVDAAMSGRPLPVHGDGLQTRDFTFVGDVCAVLADAVHRGVATDGPVNLAFGTRVSLLELIGELELVLGRQLGREHQPTRAGDVRDSQADTTVLRSLFPAATVTPLRDGLQATVDWFATR